MRLRIRLLVGTALIGIAGAILWYILHNKEEVVVETPTPEQILKTLSPSQQNTEILMPEKQQEILKTLSPPKNAPQTPQDITNILKLLSPTSP